MPSHAVNGIRIEIETRGDPSHETFLLVRGLSTQLVQWPERFLDALVAAGFHVIVFDNRDAGLSTKIDAPAPDLASLLSGTAEAPYSLRDMATDTIGVLDAVGVERAHVAGMSLGGMIVQHVAMAFPERCRSLASIMSTSGAPDLPPATPEAMDALVSRPEDPEDRECVIAHSMRTQRVIASPGYAPTDAELRRYFEVAYDRCYYPEGPARQMAAVLADGSRVEGLKTIRVPTLVLHGAEDPLIHPACGEDTARHVPGAKLEIVAGMGHDLTDASSELVAGHLVTHARNAGPS